MRKIAIGAAIAAIAAAGLWFYPGLARETLNAEIVSLSPLQKGSRGLPFYELMTPLPTTTAETAFLPKLEYVKGPPERYIERIGLIFLPEDLAQGKERMFFYGRQTDNSAPAEWGSASFFKAALEYGKSGRWNPPVKVPFWSEPFAKLHAQRLLREITTGAETIAVMDQADQPAFLVEYAAQDDQPRRSSMFFFRRNSRYRVDFIADRSFRRLNPRQQFTQSFLVEKRVDALEYTSRSLAQVSLDRKQTRNVRIQELQWPMALLAANMSLEPAGVDSYFHFAGISVLLFKSTALDSADLEITDILRNNVIASGLYALDVAPDSPKTKEISALSRQLLKNFEPSEP